VSLRAKKELNNELNLTPFIDLLSTLVCFLLISAVWVSVASMDLKQSHGTEAAAPRDAAEMDVTLDGPASATLNLKFSGKAVHKVSFKEASTEALLAKFSEVLPQMKKHPGLKGALIESVLVSPNQKVTHGEMVSVLDGLRLQGLSNIGIKPTEGK
jgi:biopolymer transport protein ExbD